MVLHCIVLIFLDSQVVSSSCLFLVVLIIVLFLHSSWTYAAADDVESKVCVVNEKFLCRIPILLSSSM